MLVKYRGCHIFRQPFFFVINSCSTCRSKIKINLCDPLSTLSSFVVIFFTTKETRYANDITGLPAYNQSLSGHIH